MERDRPSYREIQSAFASTRLEPEVTDDLLEAYAAGTATEADRDIVETMMEVDPAIAEAVATLREELSSIREPLPAEAASDPPKAKRTIWKRIPAFALAAACVVLIAFGIAKSRQLALSGRDADALRAEVAVLQERLQMQSLVAESLAHGIHVPAFVADVGETRGEIQLDLKMTPQNTVVRQPVTLTWSGRDAERGIDVGVELSSGGSPVWHGQTPNGTVDVPSSVLTPGKSYSWRVVRGTNSSGWSSFRVCTAAEADRAAKIESDPTLNALDRGTLYAQMGFIADATREFQALRKTDATLAARLMKEMATAQ